MTPQEFRRRHPRQARLGSAIATTARKADIFGALIPGSASGMGFFNLSENPDAAGETPANTPMHSGAIKVQAP